jgi:hypothetical protein
MINNKDIFVDNNNIFNTKKNTVSQTEDEITFTLEGMSAENVFAKKILRADGTYKYMIKKDSNGKLYNPISIYGQEQNKTFLDRVCKSNSKFVQVNQKTFDYYVAFLSTKNIAYLNNAERERI